MYLYEAPVEYFALFVVYFVWLTHNRIILCSIVYASVLLRVYTYIYIYVCACICVSLLTVFVSFLTVLFSFSSLPTISKNVSSSISFSSYLNSSPRCITNNDTISVFFSFTLIVWECYYVEISPKKVCVLLFRIHLLSSCYLQFGSNNELFIFLFFYYRWESSWIYTILLFK